MTVEEYFQLEENDPETCYEYIDGRVYAMAGGTANHAACTIDDDVHKLSFLVEEVLCSVPPPDL